MSEPMEVAFVINLGEGYSLATVRTQEGLRIILRKADYYAAGGMADLAEKLLSPAEAERYERMVAGR